MTRFSKCDWTAFAGFAVFILGIGFYEWRIAAIIGGFTVAAVSVWLEMVVSSKRDDKTKGKP